MQTRLIAIGNSYGLRLPRSLIRQFDLDKGTVKLIVKKEGILTSPVPGLALSMNGMRFLSRQRKKGLMPKKTATIFHIGTTH